MNPRVAVGLWVFWIALGGFLTGLNLWAALNARWWPLSVLCGGVALVCFVQLVRFAFGCYPRG